MFPWAALARLGHLRLLPCFRNVCPLLGLSKWGAASRCRMGSHLPWLDAGPVGLKSTHREGACASPEAGREG